MLVKHGNFAKNLLPVRTRWVDYSQKEYNPDQIERRAGPLSRLILREPKSFFNIYPMTPFYERMGFPNQS